ncbi:hypothetical protein CPAV1605_268 [seawater metagenome]|uniref:Uncharacterized protein n=1 Tax=seawater metagenome TaxID=1561972 RepID=A0A5E8CGJ4_9ZZZZ
MDRIRPKKEMMRVILKSYKIYNNEPLIKQVLKRNTLNYIKRNFIKIHPVTLKRSNAS